MTFDERIATFFEWSFEAMDAPLFSSLLVMLILIVVAAIVGHLARKADPTQPSKGLLFYVEWGYEKLEGFVVNNMGEPMKGYTSFFFAVIPYLAISFVFGLTGLPSIIDWTAAPLSLAIILFVLIHATAIRYQHWHYFHRYVDPFAVFLPVNLITMWTPIISVSMRLFGNALSGTVIIGLVQWALGNLEGMIFSFMPSATNGIFLAPIPMGILNLYFGLFSAFVQTTVYAYLAALWVAAERPTVEEPQPLPARDELALSNA